MIARHLRSPWPQDVADALDDLRQGDILEHPPFFYARGGDVRIWNLPLGADEIENDAEAGAGADQDDPATQVEELHPDDGPPLAIITSQTCDVDEQGAPTQPWIQVSPVYRLPDDARAESLLAKQYTVELDGPELPDGRWIADLRIELPIEKSWLIGRKVRRGFRTEEKAEDFGLRLGRRRARPALANSLVDNVTGLLRAHKQSQRGRGRTRRVWQQVHRVMLEVEDGARLTPAAVRLHVITATEADAEVEEWFSEWEDLARERADAAGLELHATDFHDARSVDLHRYDRWVELDFS